MILRKFASRILDSRRFRSLWQSNTFGLIVRFLPRSIKQRLKTFYRGVLVHPRMLPQVNQSVADRWDHSNPMLSVVIPCYNYGQYIREALLSLALQTFKDFETIIVDSSSDEHTLEILEELRREGIRVLRQQKLNVSAALNHGISIARGRYVCCLGADDKLEPTYIEKCLCLLESNPGLDFDYSLVKTFGDENRVWLTEPFDLRMLLEYNHICANAVFRRIVWKKVGGFDTLMDGYEDWDFWIKVGEAGFRGKLIPEILVNYRRHGITLDLLSDKRSRTLINHIKANHYELYSNPDQIKRIQNSYRDITIPQPFLDLSLKGQYEDSKKNTMVIVASVQGVKAAEKLLSQISLALNNVRGMRVLLISTNDISYEHDDSLQGGSNQIYFLPRFLDPYSWLSFVINVIKTRSAKLVVISESQLAYEWTGAIKAGTSATIVDILKDENECRLSADHDQFIDFHVTISERVHELVTRDFSISGRKIYSLHELVSLCESRNELLHALCDVA